MGRSYEGGTEVHPGVDIPDQEILGEWIWYGPTFRDARKVRWGTCRDGWWAESVGSINDWPWVFPVKEDAERALAVMLAEHPADEWTEQLRRGQT